MRNEVKYDPINGKTIQVSDTNTDYTIGDWVAGIDDTAGYVIVSDTTTLNAVGSGTGGGLGDPAGANMPVFWQSTGRTDGALIDLINKIRADGIHILVDLSGYSAKNRLEIFFQKTMAIKAQKVKLI